MLGLGAGFKGLFKPDEKPSKRHRRKWGYGSSIGRKQPKRPPSKPERIKTRKTGNRSRMYNRKRAKMDKGKKHFKLK